MNMPFLLCVLSPGEHDQWLISTSEWKLMTCHLLSPCSSSDQLGHPPTSAAEGGPDSKSGHCDY